MYIVQRHELLQVLSQLGGIINKARSERIVLVDGCLDLLAKNPDDSPDLVINGIVIGFPARIATTQELI